MKFEEIEEYARMQLEETIRLKIPYPVRILAERDEIYEEKEQAHNQMIKHKADPYVAPISQALARYTDVLTAAKLMQILPEKDCRDLMYAIDKCHEDTTEVVDSTRVIDNFLATNKSQYLTPIAVIKVQRKIREERKNEQRLKELE